MLLVHQKQSPDETLQEYIQNFTDLTEKAMGIDSANITNHVIDIFLSKTCTVKHQIMSGWDAFRLAHHSLLKLKKYEGPVKFIESPTKDNSH